MLYFTCISAQKPPIKLSITGTAGISYEGYGLTTNPSNPLFYSQRKPYNLVRFIFQPIISYGDFKLPFNFNFSPMLNNFGAPPSGFGNLPGFPKPTFTQWITNPMNNIGINPSYKWIELQLGTQYLKYSDLSTGDIGIFGYGVSLSPGKFRFKYFSGVSQQAYQPYVSINPPITFEGVYKRNVTMVQIGLEKEGKYFTGFNLVKGIDNVSSIPNPLTGTPSTPSAQENFIVTFVAKFNTEKGWYGQTEIGTTISSHNVNALSPNPLLNNFKPFISTNLSSFRDHAAQAGFGKKGKNWDLGISARWLGAGYYSVGYPFAQNDKLEYTINTRFNAWKKKMNVVASIGQRIGNFSIVSSRTKQLIAKANVFTQFNEHFSINANYNNFGFRTPGLSGLKNVGNDLAVNPTYTWSTTSMSNMLSLNYSWSKFDETDYGNNTVVNNNSHTALLMYVPSFFSKPNFSVDASAMYFSNKTDPGNIRLRITTFSVSAGQNFVKSKINLKGQLQYNITQMNPSSASNNLVFTLINDWNITKKVTWNTSITLNLFKYGDELNPPPSLVGAQYLESMLKTALLYRFGK